MAQSILKVPDLPPTVRSCGGLTAIMQINPLVKLVWRSGAHLVLPATGAEGCVHPWARRLTLAGIMRTRGIGGRLSWMPWEQAGIICFCCGLCMMHGRHEGGATVLQGLGEFQRIGSTCVSRASLNPQYQRNLWQVICSPGRVNWFEWKVGRDSGVSSEQSDVSLPFSSSRCSCCALPHPLPSPPFQTAVTVLHTPAIIQQSSDGFRCFSIRSVRLTGDSLYAPLQDER